MVQRKPWEGSTRKSRLPADWPKRRQQIIKRDKVCQWRVKPDDPICGYPGNQVDHIEPGDDHSLDNLQLLCETHHAIKSAREGGQSFIPLNRPPERHPMFG